MTMIKRTGGADFPDKLKALVAGPPKSGKTTLLGTIPNIIIADTEPKANNLASLSHLDVPYVTINRTADLRELCMVLGNDTLRAEAANAAGMPSIDAVAIDTMDTLQKILKRERLEEQHSTQFLRDDWGWMKEEMIKIVEAFTALPLHVVFTVHLKTQDIGTEKNPLTKILPGLEGAIASEIAGMVGYSLRSYRKEEIDPVTGNKFTKYLLQAEGDETYDFLGTRTAGRLPSVIDPDFGTIYKAAMAGRPAPQAQAPVAMPAIQTTAPAAAPEPTGPPTSPPAAPQQAPQQVAAPAPQQTQGVPANTPQPTQQAPIQPPIGEPGVPAQTATPGPDSGPAPSAAQPATTVGPDGRPTDDSPANEPAVQAASKVYAALEIAFPEQLIRGLTIGEVRTLVKMWQACQADEAAGSTPAGKSAKIEMVDYLTAMQWMPDPSQAAPAPQAAIVPSLEGTIEQAKAWVGDGSDLARVQHAYDTEVAGKNRSSLTAWLESKGAQPAQAPQAAQPTEAPGTQPVQQPVAQAPEQAPVPAQQVEQPVQQPVTQAPATVDAPPTEEEATKAVQEGLGGVVIEDSVNVDAKCEVCGNPIDDGDIAKLAKTRFNKVLCVNDYIAATKA